MVFVIRNYLSSDFDRLADFYGRTAEPSSIPGNSYSELLVRRLKRPGFDPSNNIYLAEQKSKLIGYADLVYEKRIKRAVVDIFVSSPHRHQGLGREFMDRLIKRGRELSAISLQANVPEFNQEAFPFLLKQKFSIVRYFHNLQMDISKNLFKVWDFKDSILKNFRIGEEEELAALQNKIFSGSWGFNPNTVEEIKYYLQLTSCRMDEVLCIVAKKQKIGYLWPHKLPNDSGRRRIRIHMLGVDPEFQGQGLGKKLLQTAIYHMENQGAKTVELTVDSENTPAVSLYNSLGFTLKSRSLWYEKILS
ncbi:MAG: GNAT family N-acetyltransferase [Candidatus Aminicenantaceae bacterium]